jgi:hypothetical protein
LTFNTTSLPLHRALRSKCVLERQPLRSLGEDKRYVLVTPEVDALLDGHIAFGLFPSPAAERLIAEFAAGWQMTASRKFTKRKPDVEQIVGYDEVWALCPRRPPPGWRILGRFYEPGTFIGLRAFEKRWLAKNYATACQWMIDEWNEIFRQQPPYRANSTQDYVTGLCKDVDENE